MAIKSFQGSRKQQNTSDVTQLKVKDYMSTKLITFRPDQTVQEVVEALIKHKISGGPVVNERQELVGIISEGDCLKQLSESRYYNMPLKHDNVELRMAKGVETIDGNMDVFDAANKFLNSKRRRFPIVENGKLVGQISQKDILIAALELKGENWNSATKKGN
ncbi:CBS domain-containing protein [Winogradskyella sediminis]|uniref:CBS domain-containing protein n=1 Tax=Winogradskyella sediminis TaxID=1382466 RepID=A0A1H1SS03_9FLAO|nr:CBS domain-containing protein [Winogradskyella sediminis]REG89179.1 CBS domain-containing protein [Winogradskyella sediminis]SDS50711.1 CBS domain-containing protein [Winogradskyella sediminis]